MKAKEELNRITQTFLSDHLELGQIKSTADDFFELLCRILEFYDSDEMNRSSVFTEYGRAISPFEAAHCTKEFMRTQQFIKGLNAAVKEAQKKFPEEQIRILYAGTGPFGTLMLPLTCLYSKDQIQFTLMEINPISLEYLKKTIAYFELSDYVEDFLLADASTYTFEEKGGHHILMTETMQQALKNEPQVGITLNLLPQIHPEGLLVPESIQVSLILMDGKKNFRRKMGEEGLECFFNLGQILNFNIDAVKKILSEHQRTPRRQSFRCQSIQIPDAVDSCYNEVSLMTEIQIYQNHWLRMDECSLNLPLKIKDGIKWIVPRKVIGFEYEITNLPKFVWEA